MRRARAELDPQTINLATLAWLAGAAANEKLLREVRGTKHPKLRNAHGYVFQHLLETRLLERVGQKGVDDARRALVALLQVSGGLDAVTKRRVKPPST